MNATPLRVALVYRNDERGDAGRMVGWWSYPVKEFDWVHVPVENGFRLDLPRLQRDGLDLVVWEDHKAFGEMVNREALPVAYVVVDSTLSEDHYRARLAMARQADLVLVDHDDLSRFAGLGKPVRRLGYCVNDRLFRDYGLPKDVDICYHVRPTPERVELHEWLEAFCRKSGYVYAAGKRIGEDYAKAFNRAKVSVHLTRGPRVRAHRTFDVMACRSALVTSPLPVVCGEEDILDGVHYHSFHDTDELACVLSELLSSGLWREIAECAYEQVHGQHTWCLTAKRLRWIFSEVFGL